MDYEDLEDCIKYTIKIIDKNQRRERIRRSKGTILTGIFSTEIKYIDRNKKKKKVNIKIITIKTLTMDIINRKIIIKINPRIAIIRKREPLTNSK